MITADDRYSMLTRDPATNQVTVRHGVFYDGSLEYLQVAPNRVQVNFISDLQSTVISSPVITMSPEILIINNNGVAQYWYVPEL